MANSVRFDRRQPDKSSRFCGQSSVGVFDLGVWLTRDFASVCGQAGSKAIRQAGWQASWQAGA